MKGRRARNGLLPFLDLLFILLFSMLAMSETRTTTAEEPVRIAASGAMAGGSVASASAGSMDGSGDSSGSRASMSSCGQNTIGPPSW